MNLYYKHYERPSFRLHEGGYFMTEEMWSDYNYQNHYENEVSDCIVSTEDNINYFNEAGVVTKINQNENDYFDFSKAILDIGAGVGCYSIRTPFKKIYAFEPNRKLNALLNMNLLLHDKLDDTMVFNVLLSDKRQDILYDGVHTIMKDQYVSNIDASKFKIYRTIVLDDFEFNNIGLIKIDTEGMEESILNGSINTIMSNNYPPIIFKLVEPSQDNMTTSKYESTMGLLHIIGYKVIKHYGHENIHLAIHD